MRKPLGVSLKSTTDLIIISLIASFVIQSIFRIGSVDIISSAYLGCNSQYLENGYIWSVLTYSLFHEDIIHLLFNLLGIHFISRTVERMLDKPEYYFLISCSVFLGSICWLMFNYGSQSQLIGASAFVMGSLTFFCLRKPNDTITFLLLLLIPVRMKPKYILFGILGIEIYGFIFSELPSGQSSNIAHSAHLGGALAGFIVHKLESAGFSIPRFKFASNPKVNINPYSRKESHGTSSYKINFPKASDLEDDVNRILDKINEHGFGSLSKEEKNILEKAKSLFSEKDL